jgi:hypothetical protein
VGGGETDGASDGFLVLVPQGSLLAPPLWVVSYKKEKLNIRDFSPLSLVFTEHLSLKNGIIINAPFL